MNFGNNGITLDVYDNEGKHQGDLRNGKATIKWCRGKTQKGNGVKKKSTDLIAFRGLMRGVSGMLNPGLR